MKRAAFLVLGLLFVALGVIGVFVPLMPTTIFLILAAGCFTRSSPRLEDWLLNHPRLGPPLVAWREHGVVPPRAKALAALGIAGGFVLFYAAATPSLTLAAVVATVLAGVLAFILSRPSRAGDRPARGAGRPRRASDAG